MDHPIRTNITAKLMDYASSGKHPLWPTQVQVLKDIAAHLDAGNDYGYVKRPTGTGKTVNYVAEIEALGMPALIITPRTNLTTQIHDTFLNRELFDFDPEQIGVYHGDRTDKENDAALKAPILITTFASYVMLSKLGDISGKERPLVILDEVHHARGDVVRPLVQDLFGDVYVQGWTATDTFVTGQNIGYYLFNGRPPIHVTTIQKAIENGEIAPYKNVIVEPHLGSGVKVSGSRDYTPNELERIVRETGRDEAAIRLFLELHDDETGLALRDMKSIWYCAGIEHAERVAEKLTDIFGENYALAVSGQTSKRDLEEILDMHRKGKLPILVNADLLIEGFDSPSTQLAMMLRPTRSPIVAEQTGGRILRKDPNNPSKLGYIVTFVDQGMYDILPFGLVAGEMIYIPKGVEFHSRPRISSGTKKLNYYDYPEISGVEVHISQLELDEFIRKRNEILESVQQGYYRELIQDTFQGHPYFARFVRSDGTIDERAFRTRYEQFLNRVPLRVSAREIGITEREREILLLRANSEDHKVTLQEVGLEYEISAEWARQIEANALKRVADRQDIMDVLLMEEYEASEAQGIEPVGLDIGYAKYLKERYHTAADLAMNSIRNFGFSAHTLSYLIKAGIKAVTELQGSNDEKLAGYGLTRSDIESVRPYLYPSGAYIGNLGLSNRTVKTLSRAGIHTTEQLREKTDRELLGVRNLGRTMLKEIRQVLMNSHVQ